MYVALEEWLAVVEREYLASFVPAGGAAVKFAVTAPAITPMEVRGGLEALAARRNLLCIALDAASTRLHFIDHLFHAVARQIDWDALAATLMRRLLTVDGFVLPPVGDPCDYARIADLSGTTEAEVRRRARALLTEQVARDYSMMQEFRFAMLRLCQAQLEPNRADLAEVAALHGWLRGELRLISALKPAGIFQKVARHVARDMFLSLTHWLRLTGISGLVLVLDISRYLCDKRLAEPDGLLFHSSTAVMDAYEVLRQFIDATDELEGCFIVATAPPAFLTDEKRGLAKYAALRLRIWDEVRDRRLANPLSSLVRLSEQVA